VKLGNGRRHTSAEKKQECTLGEKVHQMGAKRQPLPIHLGVKCEFDSFVVDIAKQPHWTNLWY
jgi:hypothetical protein